METLRMPTLPWSDALELGLAFMDDTHREFVDLLAQAESASDAALPAAWDALVAHTADHFGREDAWMRATRFSSSNCHTLQHQAVLAVLREGAARAAQGDLAPARQMIGELAVWFPHHAQSMDAALALHLRGVGYDAATGQVTCPDALPASEIHGCGGACSTPAQVAA
jgi:hemerythrin-like metal-binding protein